MSSNKSVIVVGAGLVGAVQALLFAKAGFSVTVVERNQLRDKDNLESHSISSRTVALSHRSWQLLTDTGLWPDIDSCAIRVVRVTEQGKFGSVKLEAQQLDVEALGYVVSNTDFESYLHHQLKNHSLIKVFETAVVASVENSPESASVTIEQAGVSRQLTASLVVAADGTHSSVRELLGIDTKRRNYQQCALIANVRTTQPHRNIAFERFTCDGPLAMLPLGLAGDEAQGGLFSMIYTAPIDQVPRLSEMSDAEFLKSVQKKFGGSLGRFENIGKRYVAELYQTVSMQQRSGSFVLIGNAMRTLHPVAGQGMNLALRDAYELVSSVINSDITDTALENFEKLRKRDQLWVTYQTDVLARVFTDKPWPIRFPLSLLTGSGFVLLDSIEPVKKAFATASMGRHVPLVNGLNDSKS